MSEREKGCSCISRFLSLSLALPTLALLSSVAAIAAQAEPADQAELVEVKRIWDLAPHNAFTDLIRFKEQWFCVFREGQGHVSPDGKLRVISSSDGDTWTSAALLTSADGDLRDAKITVTPQGELMLSGAVTLTQPASAVYQSLSWFSADGTNWSDAVPVGDPDFWLWRATWHRDTVYSVGYKPAGDQFVRLYISQDGRSYDTHVSRLFDQSYPNETSIVFLPNDTALCLLRRDLAPFTAQLGTSQPPYTSWEWKDLGLRLGGPHMIRLPDGRLVAVGRRYDGRQRTVLMWLDAATGQLVDLLDLPSGGDTSYAGLVLHDGLLWISYYSSHESKTSVYLAKVRLPPAPTIIVQPETQYLPPGSDVTFTVDTLGPTPVRFQWRRGNCQDGTDIVGATNRSYSLSNIDVWDQGDFTVTISDGTLTNCSVSATLNVLVPALITQQPQSVTAVQGDDVKFFVTATGNPLPMTYRWRLNGRTQTNYDARQYSSTYIRSDVQPEDAGRYTVVVANIASVGVLSQTAILTVLEDTDGDHIPDAYEDETAGLDASNPNDGGLDSDGDGFTNLQEYRAGTDLNDPLSFLKVEMPSIEGGQPVLSFSAMSNRSYSVQFREAVDAGRWTRLVDAPASPSNRVEQIVDVLSLTDERLYRLVTPQQPPPEPGPTILRSPLSQEALVGTDVTLSVTVDGVSPLVYQWWFNGGEIRGATNATLWLPDVQTDQTGVYEVTIRQLFGLTRSEPAFVDVVVRQ